ncbi:MAG: FeoB-associated Cys-rich membrane protein [Pedobacter sp.]|nr:FeoB-associated Cys-rich membrane protein [Pedobacter sp.]MDQ8052830.1 FeoB-associated Cys-rich membrane protein [Pedobacter sp.]
MDIQFVLVVLIFFAALAYIGRLVYQAVSPKKEGCATGCGKCAANFDSIQTPKN